MKIKYDKEYKLMAVKRVKDSGRPAAEIAKEEKLDLIHLDKNWKNLKDDPEFQMITWKY